MVDVPLTVGFFAAVLPAFGVLFVAYNGYDRAFKDQTLFLFLMGGGAAGIVMYLFEAALLAASARPGGFWFGLGMASVGFALLDQLLATAVVNRRQHQGQRASVYYGGAFGMGFAAMLGFIHALSDFPLWLMDVRGQVLPGAVGVVFLALALTTLHFATGALVGVGVAERKLRERLPLAVAAAVPFNALLFLFLRGCGTPGDPSSFQLGACNPGLLGGALLYALGLGAWAALKLLPLGLDANQRRERRRIVRKQEA